MANKVFNNERPANVNLDMTFYGRMGSSGVVPGPNFTTGETQNPTKDYGNSWSQKIRSGMVAVKDNPRGLNRR